MSSAREDADAMEGALLDAIAAFETEISKLKAENAKLKAEIEQRADHESYLSQEFANTYYEKNARIAELEAEVAKAKAENSKWFDCYCEFETIAPDGKLKISVLELYNRLKELDAEVAALKEYRDGHDPKTDFPPEGVWVNMRDGCDDMFPVQYDPEMHWYWNLSGDDGGMEYWNLDDSCLVRWYPVPPLPELPEVEK